MAKSVGARSVDADTDDERLVQTLEQLDEYLADQQHVVEVLKQGFLKLAMAKMNVPAHALGELSYKDQFDSALYVVEESDGSLTTIQAAQREAMGDAEGAPHAEPASTLKRRANKTEETRDPTNSASLPTTASGAKAEDDAIMWFSSLPPQNLRLAQKHFRSALQALLISAASARKIQNATIGLRNAPST